MSDLKLLKFPENPSKAITDRMVNEILMNKVELEQLEQILSAIEEYMLEIDDIFAMNSAFRIAEARFWLNSLT